MVSPLKMNKIVRRIPTQRSNIVKWTVPVVGKLGVSTTARGSGPCPDGDGGSEAM